MRDKNNEYCFNNRIINLHQYPSKVILICGIFITVETVNINNQYETTIDFK